jgi:hypothetical protein
MGRSRLRGNGLASRNGWKSDIVGMRLREGVSILPTLRDAIMAINAQTAATKRVLDKRILREAVDSLQKRLGLSHDPKMTGDQSQKISLASGVKPEDDLISSEIIRMRHDEKM